MQLSEHFTLEEFTLSQTAVRAGIDNDPPPQIAGLLAKVTAPGMEEVRAVLGGLPIQISSGYRSPALNAKVGGSGKSAHCMGYAVDFTCAAAGPPLHVARLIWASESVAFDQLIHEFGTWVHISFDPRMRRQLLTIDKHGTRPGLEPVRP